MAGMRRAGWRTARLVLFVVSVPFVAVGLGWWVADEWIARRTGED